MLAALNLGSHAAISDKLAHVQDGIAGIKILFSTANLFDLGDKVRINLTGCNGTNVNGQKSLVDVLAQNVIGVAQNVQIAAEIVTLADLASGEYSGKKVRINDVTFTDAKGLAKFLGNHRIEKDGQYKIIATYQDTEFADFTLPSGTPSIIGIVGDWGYLFPQSYLTDIIRS